MVGVVGVAAGVVCDMGRVFVEPCVSVVVFCSYDEVFGPVGRRAVVRGGLKSRYDRWFFPTARVHDSFTIYPPRLQTPVCRHFESIHVLVDQCEMCFRFAYI